MSYLNTFPATGRLILPLLCSLLLITGCASPRWYHPTGTQADFDRDDADCRHLAEEMARQGTVTGRANFELYVKAYESCLFSRGWSTTASRAEVPSLVIPPTTAERVPLIELTPPARMNIFGYALTLPDDFVLQEGRTQSMDRPGWRPCSGRAPARPS